MSPEIEIIIEYEGFIAGRELSEIIEALDEALWDEIQEEELYPFPPRFYTHGWRLREPTPLVCISAVQEGSISLTCILGGVAAKYCYDRFKRGFRRSRVGDEIEHFGNTLGNNIKMVLQRVNSWLDDYTEHARANHSHIKKIRAREKNSKEERGSKEKSD